MSNSWRGGSTRAWRRVRLGVLIRDGYQCQIALPGVCTGTATQVHHTVGRSVSGDDPRYLVASCRDCNLKRGDPTKHSFKPRKMTRW